MTGTRKHAKALLALFLAAAMLLAGCGREEGIKPSVEEISGSSSRGSTLSYSSESTHSGIERTTSRERMWSLTFTPLSGCTS